MRNKPLMKLLRFAWDRLLIITGVIGDVQGRIIALLFYFTVLIPFGIGSRLFSDPLQRKAVSGSSHWLTRQPVPNSVDDARRQW
jgi:hypothetical protein